MPEVRRRRTPKTTPVTRRRDRSTDEDGTEEEEAEETEVEVTERSPRRSPAPAAESSEEEDWDEEGEEEEAPRPKKRRPPVAEEEDDEDAEEEPAPKKRIRRPVSNNGLPLGVRAGNEGAEATTRGGGGATRLALSETPELIKALDNKVLVSFRQHWVPQGGGQPDRPYVCIGSDCPLCEMGDQSSGTFIFNVLHLSDPAGPTNKILQMGVKAYKSWKATATGRDEKVHYDKDFWAVNRSGKGQQSQTNFRPVKERDLEEDWEELADIFDFDDLDAIVEDAKGDMYDTSIIPGNSRKQLLEVAKYFADE